MAGGLAGERLLLLHEAQMDSMYGGVTAKATQHADSARRHCDFISTASLALPAGDDLLPGAGSFICVFIAPAA